MSFQGANDLSGLSFNHESRLPVSFLRDVRQSMQSFSIQTYLIFLEFFQCEPTCESQSNDSLPMVGRLQSN